MRLCSGRGSNPLSTRSYLCDNSSVTGRNFTKHSQKVKFEVAINQFNFERDLLSWGGVIIGSTPPKKNGVKSSSSMEKLTDKDF